jgi:glycine/sarcosine N-methyltransferase
MEAQAFYDGLGEDYDRMVSWETRLAREELFFRKVFEDHGARSVLDAGCGTGMHAISFARRGLQSAGADLSPAMIDTAKNNARRAGVQVAFEVAAFGGMAGRFATPFDAVICVGNSLPHLSDDEALRSCLADFSTLLRPGGILVIQNRNYDRLLQERQRFMPVATRVEGDDETLFLRITDFPAACAKSAESVELTIITLKKRGGRWSQSAQTTPLRALRRRTMESALAAAGFGSVQAFGGYAMAPFDGPSSADLIVVAVR